MDISLLVARRIKNTYMHHEDKTQSFLVLQDMVHIVITRINTKVSAYTNNE
jgi:hypothetical protein